MSARWQAVLLVAACLAPYAGGLAAPFVFDDHGAILENPHIVSVAGSFRGSRPLTNLSFALNRAWGGVDPRGYRVVNAGLHALAALLLLAVLRRVSEEAAFAGALLWAVHPVQTESVAYAAQRSECLAAMCTLALLWASARAEASRRPAAWQAAGLAAFAAGMASKETAAVAPLLLLLFDRTCLAGSFHGALCRRPMLYAGLATLLALGVRRLGLGSRAWGTPGVDAGAYLAAQPGAVLHYLHLAVWPRSLVLDYAWSHGLGGWGGAAALLALGTAAAWGLLSRPRIGLAAAGFLVCLLPTSLVPLQDAVFEHRLYLALAVPAALAASALRPRAALLAAVSASFLVLSMDRVGDYASPHRIWADVVAKRPSNPRARAALAKALSRQGAPRTAVRQLEAAVRLKPDYATGHQNLAMALLELGDREGALRHLHEAVRLRPGYSLALGQLQALEQARPLHSP